MFNSALPRVWEVPFSVPGWMQAIMVENVGGFSDFLETYVGWCLVIGHDRLCARPYQFIIGKRRYLRHVRREVKKV